MTNYNSGEWFGWNGGECPVHPDTVVEIVTTEGSSEGPALAFVWDESDHLNNWIVAFRVVKEYRESLEVYLSEWIQYDILSGKPCAKSTWSECSPDTPGAVLFREVIE